jgi:hypothetical protein
MGYRVKSVFGILPKKDLAYFLYFIPGFEYQPYEYEWIIAWVDDRFRNIAQRISSRGALICPVYSNYEDGDALGEILKIGAGPFETVLGNIRNNRSFSPKKNCDSEYKDDLKSFSYLHGDYPILILSRTPLTRSVQTAGYVVNLAMCENESEIGYVFDTILEIINSDDIEKLKNLEQFFQSKMVPEGKWYDYFDIKPNFFGLGINFNKVLDAIAKRISSK